MSTDQPPVPDWLFNLKDETRGIPRTLSEGLKTRIFSGEHVMLSFVRIEPHSQGKMHSHPEEQWGVLMEGACIRIQEGEEISVKAGDFWYSAGHVPHGIRTESEGAFILDIFGPPRPEYKKAGTGFGRAEAESGET